ncbi:ferric-chelate reductase [Nannizzia gypsea CBS 118893]|uniref:Ferric-chelate reductase n=1 Tax=Arthroderma gypseum (strain ATCC MYA-4604 / CBS 118893) TaxID=535722 RepID=E5R0A2_ARTGP|nr:ferric-chelate reductase [Nannizzia gypsea CBS 118893]EFQ98298.1 ferric-chelate reductase [Nannizzia gypsea CBS 118893]
MWTDFCGEYESQLYIRGTITVFRRETSTANDGKRACLIVSSKELANKELCFSAIYRAYRPIIFAGTSGKEQWAMLCQNRLKVGSMYASAKVYCQPEEILPGAAVLGAICERRISQPLLPMSDFAANLTNTNIATMRVIENGEIPKKETVDSLILISEKFFRLSLKTVTVDTIESKNRHAYGFAMYGIWGTVLVVGIIHNFFTWAFFNQLGRKGVDLEGGYALKFRNLHQVFRPLSYLSNWVQTHVAIPSVFGSYHLRTLYGCDIPTRLEAIVIFSYWLIIAVLCCVNYELFVGNLVMPTTNAQLCRYLANRTGVLAFANLPLAWMFAGRNNIFLWATGWSFRMFNIFHRQAALAATLLAIVHSIAYTALYFLIAAYQSAFREKWFSMGVVGTVAMSFLVILSCLWFRKKSYELFLLIHIALSAVIIAAMFSHVSIFSGEYDPYLWPLVAIWGFDRILRLIRIIYCNIRVRFARGGLQHTSTVAYYDKLSDIIRLEVTPAATGISQKPGRYYFLYQPFRWTGYESHPFTLGAWVETPKPVTENGSESGLSSNTVDENGKNGGLCHGTKVSNSQNPGGNSSNEIKYIFWIRPYNGWTRQLRDQCVQSGDTATSTTLLLEGPYGDTAPLWAFESVLLIVGGTGITAAVPYIQDHIRRASSTAEGTCVKNITLIWSARQASFIHDVASRELRPAFGREDFRASFYLTDKSAAPIVPSPTCTETTSSLNTTLPDGRRIDSKLKTLAADLKYDVKYGRPDTRSIILEGARSANMANSWLAVLVCGPDGLADEARDAIHYTMLQGYLHIRYIEDAYSW